MGDVAAALRESIGLLLRRMRQRAPEGELTLPESAAMTRLSRCGPTTSSALAKLEQISPQSIGATLQSLEAKGLITRAPDPDDGRRVILSLTDAGRGTVHSKRSARTEQLTRALAKMSADERSRLLAAVPVLERLSGEL